MRIIAQIDCNDGVSLRICLVISVYNVRINILTLRTHLFLIISRSGILNLEIYVTYFYIVKL